MRIDLGPAGGGEHHQGPWYTVGYKMAVLVEKRYGRAALIRTMLDYRCLLALYNQAAAEQTAAHKEPLPLWSDAVLSQVGATTCGVPAAARLEHLHQVARGFKR